MFYCLKIKSCFWRRTLFNAVDIMNLVQQGVEVLSKSFWQNAGRPSQAFCCFACSLLTEGERSPGKQMVFLESLSIRLLKNMNQSWWENDVAGFLPFPLPYDHREDAKPFIRTAWGVSITFTFSQPTLLESRRRFLVRLMSAAIASFACL